MTFQASNYKRRNFLDLYNDKAEYIHSIYLKGGVWLKYCGLFSSLYTWIIRVITNHSPIGEYKLRFFPKESIACPYSNYPIKTRRYILYKCL